MSLRRSARPKVPVTYTSDSEASDYATTSTIKAHTTPRKSNKRSPPADNPLTLKRRKEDADTPASSASALASPADKHALKTSRNQAWDAWQTAHHVHGQVMDTEPPRDKGITQTDCGRKYALRPDELASLRHFARKKRVYGGTTRVYVEEEVRALAGRKAAILGEESVEKKYAVKTKTKTKTARQMWREYVAAHALEGGGRLAGEPDRAINQTLCGSRFGLTPRELACLEFFSGKKAAYGHAVKLFGEREVEALAYRKEAVLAGVEEGSEMALLVRGKELFEQRQEGQEWE